MKTRFLLLMMLLVTAVSFAGTAIAQDAGLNLTDYVATFSALIATSVLLVDLARTKLNLKGIGLQIFSWGISLLLSFLSFWLKVGLFDGTETILNVVIIGAAASLAANGLADTGLIKAILSLLGVQVKDKKKTT